MNIIIGNPAKYIQGPGALKDIGKYAAKMGLGKKALVTGGKTALKLTMATIEESFKANHIAFVLEPFGGESTQKEIDRLVAVGKKNKVDFIVGVGGGKVADTAKALTIDLKCPVAVVPTVPATDASCSATSVVYSEDHIYQGVVVEPRNPELVLADTDILIKAPFKFLLAGMGDGLSTKFEAEAAHKSHTVTNHGGYGSSSGMTLARWCSDTIIEKGAAAVKAAKKGVSDAAFEDVVEACIYASSVSWENCGLATAHGMAGAFTMIKETEEHLHGHMVGFFTLVQIVLEKTPAAYRDQVFRFCHSVGMPVTLAEVNMGKTPKAEIMKAAKAAAGSYVKNEPFPVTPEMIYDALMETDRIGRALK